MMIPRFTGGFRPEMEVAAHTCKSLADAVVNK